MACIAMATAAVFQQRPSSVLSPPATPLLDALKRSGEKKVASFHFPGHGRGASAPSSISNLLGARLFQFDLPELPGLDNLHSPQEAIAEAQHLAAELFGAGSSWFLVNGSTCGIQAAVMSCCKPGDVLILPRNAHFSAFSAMVLAGAVPHYVAPCYDELWEVSHGVSAASIESAISELQEQHPDLRVGAVLLVSPTYFGVCSPVESIAEVCHRRRIPLIVDEAHGAHFKFHSKLPATALEQGADVVVQSTHKVLSSLTQSGMLHLADGCEIVSAERISKCLRSLQSSSPSYLLMASLDAARGDLCRSGDGDHPVFDAALELASRAREGLKQIPRVAVLDRDSVRAMDPCKGGVFLDALRITVGLWDLGVTGTFADEFLCERCDVVAELPLLSSITFALGAGNSGSDVDQLVHGFRKLSTSLETNSPRLRLPRYDQNIGWKMLVNPRDAFFSESRCCKAEEAVGFPSAELVCPYPPGIPLLFPGELVSREVLEFLKQARESGIIVSGASDESLSTLRILDD